MQRAMAVMASACPTSVRPSSASIPSNFFFSLSPNMVDTGMPVLCATMAASSSPPTSQPTLRRASRTATSTSSSAPAPATVPAPAPLLLTPPPIPLLLPLSLVPIWAVRLSSSASCCRRTQYCRSSFSFCATLFCKKESLSGSSCLLRPLICSTHWARSSRATKISPTSLFFSLQAAVRASLCADNLATSVTSTASPESTSIPPPTAGGLVSGAFVPVAFCACASACACARSISPSLSCRDFSSRSSAAGFLSRLLRTLLAASSMRSMALSG
mmetsp:Transcript_31125/g.68631  ORF Transcript_31125/g.68631 Transcript_31125/m.68631 type:complete len:272 (+) Transcript_31125:468-1283(+)